MERQLETFLCHNDFRSAVASILMYPSSDGHPRHCRVTLKMPHSSEQRDLMKDRLPPDSLDEFTITVGDNISMTVLAWWRWEGEQEIECFPKAVKVEAT